MSEPRILFFDLETDGVNALHADLGFVTCFGYKWGSEKRTHCLTIGEEDLRTFNDKPLLTEASKLMTEADILVAHFGSVFDRRFFVGRLLINGLPPIPPTRMRDTCMIARSIANFRGNRLAHLAEILGLPQRKQQKKVPDEWPGWWFRVMQGDMKALADMAAYCRQDVKTLEAIYNRLLPFDQPHPRIYHDRTKCPTCNGEVQYRGTLVKAHLRYRRYQCTACGRWGQDHTALKP